MAQLDLLDKTLVIDRNHLSIRLLPDFISASKAKTLLKEYIDTTPWQQPRVKVWGKWHRTPRLVCFFGDEQLDYAYSSTLHGTRPWIPSLLDLKTRVSRVSNAQFNAVLLNYYRDGHDTMGWHADDEPELGDRPTIASLSLGAARDIHFKAKSADGEPPISLKLPSGSLLLMQGDTQRHWLHHVPKRLKCTAPRVNLTFRTIFSTS